MLNVSDLRTPTNSNNNFILPAVVVNKISFTKPSKTVQTITTESDDGIKNVESKDIITTFSAELIINQTQTNAAEFLKLRIKEAPTAQVKIKLSEKQGLLFMDLDYVYNQEVTRYTTECYNQRIVPAGSQSTPYGPRSDFAEIEYDERQVPYTATEATRVRNVEHKVDQSELAAIIKALYAIKSTDPNAGNLLVYLNDKHVEIFKVAAKLVYDEYQALLEEARQKQEALLNSLAGFDLHG